MVLEKKTLYAGSGKVGGAGGGARRQLYFLQAGYIMQ